MSTRCMVKVTSSGLSWDDVPIFLYHHCDGYPSNILPLLEQAFRKGVDQISENYKKWGGKPDLWELGRAGKVAGLICSVDPLQFEPEPWSSAQFDKELAPYHADLEYVYSVHCVNKTNPADRGAIRWIITVYQPKDWKIFGDNPTQENLVQVGPKIKLTP